MSPVHADTIASLLVNGLPASVLGFALAVLILEFFDISLPRGDTLGVSGAIDSAAVLVVGPIPALFAAVSGTLLAFVARRGTERHTHPFVEMLALLAAMAAAILADFLAPTALNDNSLHYAKALMLSAVYLLTELVVVQCLVSRSSSRPLMRLIRGNLVRQAPLLAAQLSASVLTVIIYDYMAAWGLALVVVLLLLIRQSYAMLLDIRETYLTTIQVLVEVAESPDGRMRGHGERTAEIARDIGARCGLSPADVEHISYAALLHDIDAIGYEAGGPREVCRPSEVLKGVGSFQEVAALLRIFETPKEVGATDSQLLAAFVLALATDIDASSHPDLRLVHRTSAVERLAGNVPRDTKAKAVSAALRLGYRIPAVA